MFIVMAVVFVLGYTGIALEHPLKVDKAATALLTGVLLWILSIITFFMSAALDKPDSHYRYGCPAEKTDCKPA